MFQRCVQNASGSDFSAEVQSANACVLSSATVPLGPGKSSAGVTLCTGNNPQLSSSGFGWLHQTPSCFCTSYPHCKYSGWLIKKKSVEQLQNAEGGKYLLPGFPPTHPACGTVHSSDRNRMDQIPSGTNSCFTTRPVSVTRGKVIPCHCPLVAGWRRWPVSRLRQWQVSMCGCMSSTPSPSASWAGEKPGPWAPKLEDLSLPGTTCSLHTGAGLSKQLLHFTRNYRPGAAENEGPTVRAAVILPGSASMSLLIPGCTAARGTERTMPLSSVPLRASPILEVSWAAPRHIRLWLCLPGSRHGVAAFASLSLWR